MMPRSTKHTHTCTHMHRVYRTLLCSYRTFLLDRTCVLMQTFAFVFMNSKRRFWLDCNYNPACTILQTCQTITREGVRPQQRGLNFQKNQYPCPGCTWRLPASHRGSNMSMSGTVSFFQEENTRDQHTVPCCTTRRQQQVRIKARPEGQSSTVQLSKPVQFNIDNIQVTTMNCKATPMNETSNNSTLDCKIISELARGALYF